MIYFYNKKYLEYSKKFPFIKPWISGCKMELYNFLFEFECTAVYVCVCVCVCVCVNAASSRPLGSTCGRRVCISSCRGLLKMQSSDG